MDKIYNLPSVDLLNKSDKDNVGMSFLTEEEVERNKKTIVEACDSFGIGVKSITVRSGASVSLYELKLKSMFVSQNCVNWTLILCCLQG